jgi:hypothetical protein
MLRTQMPHRRVDKTQSLACSQIVPMVEDLPIETEQTIGRAEVSVQRIDVGKERLHSGCVYIVAQPSADLRAQGELAIGESPRPSPAGGDAARPAMAARPGVTCRATPLGDVGPLFQKEHPAPTRARKLERGEDAGRASAHDDRVIVSVGHDDSRLSSMSPKRA